MIIWKPFAIARFNATVIENTWKNGITASMVSLPGSSPCIQREHCTVLIYKLLCDSIALFGTPVVPPVYCSTAIWLSGRIFGGVIFGSNASKYSM